MAINELITQRFNELERKMNEIKVASNPNYGTPDVRIGPWQEWATSVLDLLERAFGVNSVHARNFRLVYNQFTGDKNDLDSAKGIFIAAKSDFEGGYIFGLEKTLSGEILGDFVMLAKTTL